MVVQGRSLQTSTLRQLPHCNSKAVVDFFGKATPPIHYLPQMMALSPAQLRQLAERAPGIHRGGVGGGGAKKRQQKSGAETSSLNRLVRAVAGLPLVDVSWSLEDENGHVLRGGSKNAAASSKQVKNEPGGNTGKHGMFAPKVARLSEDGDYEVSTITCAQ